VTQSLPPAAAAAFEAAVKDWNAGGKIARSWNRDAGLWTSAQGSTAENLWMGWLDIVERQTAQGDRFREIASRVKAGGYRNAVLPGMGGSSLCPEVLSVTFGHQPGSPIPGNRFTFGMVKAAARGDFGALASRGRRALRVHLPADVEAVAALGKAIRTALG
jgi:hypothetical protein